MIWCAPSSYPGEELGMHVREVGNACAGSWECMCGKLGMHVREVGNACGKLGMHAGSWGNTKKAESFDQTRTQVIACF